MADSIVEEGRFLVRFFLICVPVSCYITQQTFASFGLFTFERIAQVIIISEHYLASIALKLEVRFNSCEFYNIRKTRIAEVASNVRCNHLVRLV